MAAPTAPSPSGAVSSGGAGWGGAGRGRLEAHLPARSTAVRSEGTAPLGGRGGRQRQEREGGRDGRCPRHEGSTVAFPAQGVCKSAPVLPIAAGVRVPRGAAGGVRRAAGLRRADLRARAAELPVAHRGFVRGRVRARARAASSCSTSTRPRGSCSGARGRRADPDPVPGRARGRGGDAPGAPGTCRSASSCWRCRSPAALVALATYALTDLGWTESFLLGALLSPTDPVLSSAIVNNPRVPRLIRHSLNLESGLNDGLALPAVLALTAVRGERRGLRLVAVRAPGRGRRRGDRRAGGLRRLAAHAAQARARRRDQPRIRRRSTRSESPSRLRDRDAAARGQRLHRRIRRARSRSGSGDPTSPGASRRSRRTSSSW